VCVCVYVCVCVCVCMCVCVCVPATNDRLAGKGQLKKTLFDSLIQCIAQGLGEDEEGGVWVGEWPSAHKSEWGKEEAVLF